MRVPIPLRRRPLDIAIVGFFAVNLFFITYIVDLEQLVVADPSNFRDPLWPPRAMIDLVHWWGRTFDPVLMARPAFWRATIWIDALFFGPFYALGLYAWTKGRDWIRIPSVMWASVMLTNVTIILFEEFLGRNATPRPGMVFLANLGWLVFPLLVLWRTAAREHPFTAAGPHAR